SGAPDAVLAQHRRLGRQHRPGAEPAVDDVVEDLAGQRLRLLLGASGEEDGGAVARRRGCCGRRLGVSPAVAGAWWPAGAGSPGARRARGGGFLGGTAHRFLSPSTLLAPSAAGARSAVRRVSMSQVYGRVEPLTH